MRLITILFSIASLLCLALTMKAGLSVAHGQVFYISHLSWGFASIAIVAVTLTLCLLFIFKMHRIIHDLIKKLDENPPRPPFVKGGQGGI